MPETAANVPALPVPSNDDSRIASGSTVELISASDTDEPVEMSSEDSDFFVDTPTSRVVKCENKRTTGTTFMGNSTSITALVSEMNRTSSCKTDACEGKLECTRVSLEGYGGTIVMSFKCSGCSNRNIEYNSALDKENSLSRALQVAFLCGGCHYSHYEHVLKNGLGMFTVSQNEFFKTIKLMKAHVKSVLDTVCELGRQQMRDLPDDRLGSWKHAVTQADGVWLTRGHYSQNATFTLRNHLTGALLYYKHLSQRSDLGDSEEESEKREYQGTSRSAEGHLAQLVFEEAKADGMNIAVHWQDEDSTSAKCLLNVFPDCKMMLCAGHAARTFESHTKKHAVAKSYSREKVAAAFKNVPEPLLEKHFGKRIDKKVKCTSKKSAKVVPKAKEDNTCSLKCHCLGKQHKWDTCGCISDAFHKHARKHFAHALMAAGSNPDVFADRITTFGKDHIRGHHDSCTFHAKMVCSCGNCKQGELMCEGKPYESAHKLTCPFHAALFELECHDWAMRAKELIHPEIGKGHTTLVETSHFIMTKFRSKDMYLRKTHYSVSTNLGLLESSLPWLREQFGYNYHWRVELFKSMDLPILDGLEEVLSHRNKVTKRHLEYMRRPKVIRKTKRRRLFHLTTEQSKRSDWGVDDAIANRLGKVVHGYGSDQDLSPKCGKQQKCKRGSTTHSRSTSKKCPLNSKAADVTPRAASRKYGSTLRGASDHGDSIASDASLLSHDEFESSGDDSDVVMLPPCKCKYFPRHDRNCRYNPRNKGKVVQKVVPPSAVDDDIQVMSVVLPSPSTVSLCNTPTQSYKDSVVQYLGIDHQALHQSQGRPIDCPDMYPHICLDVVGDGHCMFRAISLLVIGTEGAHLHLRSAITKFMLHLYNVKQIARIIGSPSATEDVALNSVTDYIEEKDLEGSGWGTEVVLYAAAAMLQLNIFTSTWAGCRHSSHRNWIKHAPRFVNQTCLVTTNDEKYNIYLYHTDAQNHYYSVVPD